MQDRNKTDDMNFSFKGILAESRSHVRCCSIYSTQSVRKVCAHSWVRPWVNDGVTESVVHMTIHEQVNTTWHGHARGVTRVLNAVLALIRLHITETIGLRHRNIFVIFSSPIAACADTEIDAEGKKRINSKNCGGQQEFHLEKHTSLAP